MASPARWVWRIAGPPRGHRNSGSVLNSFDGAPVVPLCGDCSARWNVHGYEILKAVRPATILWHLFKFKVVRPFYGPSVRSIVAGLSRFLGWSKRFRADVRNLTGKSVDAQ